MREALVNIYFIPGLCFKGDICKHPAFSRLNCIAIDYFSLANRTLDSLANKMSQHIPANSIIISWSLGGILATKIATMAPHKITKLVFISSQPKMIADHRWPGIANDASNKFLTQANTDFTQLQLFFQNLVNYPNNKISIKNQLSQNFISLQKNVFADFVQLLLLADLRPEYSCLDQKILHIIGGKDAIISQNSTTLEKLNRNTKTACIANAGHAGFLTHPLLYHKIIKDFVYG